MFHHLGLVGLIDIQFCLGGSWFEQLRGYGDLNKKKSLGFRAIGGDHSSPWEGIPWSPLEFGEAAEGRV